MRSAALLVLALLSCTRPAPVDEPTPESCPEYDEPELVSTLEVPGLREASGLAASATDPQVLFTHNDSGSPPELFAFRLDGSWAGTWRLEPAQNVDWEDIARGPCAPGSEASCLYVGDVGDNLARREEVVIYVVPEPDLPADPAEGVLPVLRTLRAVYPDGPRDCETVLVHPESADIYLVDKPPPQEGGQTVHRLARGGIDAEAQVVLLEPVAQVRPDPSGDDLFTGGDVHPDGTRLVLRTYVTVQEHRLPAGRLFEEAFASPPVLLPRVGGGAGAFELQGEAVAYDLGGAAVFTTSEGDRPPLNRRRCRSP